MARYFALNEINDWSLWLQVSGIWVNVSEGGYSARSSISLPVAGEVEPVFSSERVYLPVRLDSELLFVIDVADGYEFDFYDSIIDQLQLIARSEAREQGTYPTFLPVVYPFTGSARQINDALYTSETLYFLNGQASTGRKLFVRNYLMLAENVLTEISSGNFYSGRHDYYFFEEIALLDDETQQYIVDLIEDDSSRIFLCSEYDLGALTERNIIIPELAGYCLQAKLIFPSIENREPVEEFADFYRRWKSYEPGFVGRNFEQVSYGLEQIDVAAELVSGRKLRDIVASVEEAAIRYAYSAAGANQNRMAKFLGISRGSLQHKFKKYRMPYSDLDE